MAYILLVSISYLFQFLALFSYHSLLLSLPPIPLLHAQERKRQRKGSEGRSEKERKEGRNWSSEAGWAISCPGVSLDLTTITKQPLVISILSFTMGLEKVEDKKDIREDWKREGKEN